MDDVEQQGRVTHRALAPGEEPLAVDVFLVTVRDLAARHGLPVPPFTREAMIGVYAHLRETGIFQVAEAEGRIVAIAAATLREDVWFLSMFWTLPEMQRRGVGRPLLERVWRRGVDRGARHQLVWSSVDFTALATYMKLGMLPVCPIFTFAGAIERPPRAPDGYSIAALDLDAVAAMDRAVRGARCPEDRSFSLAAGARGHLVERGPDVVGYFFLQGGMIGPVAWSDGAHGRNVLALALREAGGAPVRLALLGLQHEAIALALDVGLRIVSSAHLLATERFAAFERYVPSGPALY